MSLSTIILGLLMSCALIKTLFGSFILHLSGILLFEQNSGLFGGACAFYNLEVIANTRGEEAVGVFKGNSALYGGVVYLQTYFTMVVSDQWHIQTSFDNNSAVTAGNTIYFATNPNTTVENNTHLLKMNNKTRIRSLISFISTSNIILTIFPYSILIFLIIKSIMVQQCQGKTLLSVHDHFD